jgi:hypothetical protein
MILLRKTKKAMMAGLAGIIIVLAIFIILIIFFIKTSSKIGENADREVCRNSVLAHSMAKDILLSGKIIEPECKTYNIRFFNDHVEKNGKTIEVYDSRKKEKVKKFSSLTEEIIYQLVAEEYRWCWYQFLEGEKSIGEWSFFGSLSGTCFLCTEISFDNNIKIPLNELTFIEYLSKTTMPKTNKTYLDYLTPEKAIEGFSNTGIDKENYLQWLNYWSDYSSSNYILLYKAKKNSVFYHKILGFLDLPEFEGMVLTYSNPDYVYKQCDSIKRGAVK